MPAKHIEVKTLKVAHTTSDVIKIEHVEKPYGEFSSPVVSIALYSQGKTKVSEVDVPYENIQEFMKALTESVKLCESIPRSEIHAEVNAEVGGGA